MIYLWHYCVLLFIDVEIWGDAGIFGGTVVYFLH